MELEILEKILKNLDVERYGLCNISNLHEMGQAYPLAISLLVKYPEMNATYDEAEYHETLLSAKVRLNRQIAVITSRLRQEGIGYVVVPEGQDPDSLLGTFPHKLAAVHSGLGWIGKQSLLITGDFGPRIRLGTILVDSEIEVKNKIIKNGCGTCNKCAEACIYGLVTGTQWETGLNRDVLFNPFECNGIRESFIPRIHHKHSCGYCLLACPYGKTQDDSCNF